MHKAFGVFKIIFLVSATVFLVVAGIWFDRQQDFVRSASLTEGQVVELRRRSTEDGYTYAPVVQFLFGGQAVTFTSSISSNPPNYFEGEVVEVAFSPEDPSRATINTFWNIWIGPIMMAGAGVLSLGAVIGIVLFARRRKKRVSYLRQFGTRIIATVTEVRQNKNFHVNGQNPWVVYCQADFLGQSQRIFKSFHLWDDPTGMVVVGQDISVLVDMANPKRYLVDVDAVINSATP